jgi:hypothetical protein
VAGIGVEYKFEVLVVELAEFRLVADGLPERRPVRLGRPTSPTAITASSASPSLAPIACSDTCYSMPQALVTSAHGAPLTIARRETYDDEDL